MDMDKKEVDEMNEKGPKVYPVSAATWVSWVILNQSFAREMPTIRKCMQQSGRELLGPLCSVKGILVPENRASCILYVCALLLHSIVCGLLLHINSTVHCTTNTQHQLVDHPTQLICICQHTKKHRKNCECCHHHSVFRSHNVIVYYVVLKCQQSNQCLKCQVSGFEDVF